MSGFIFIAGLLTLVSLMALLYPLLRKRAGSAEAWRAGKFVEWLPEGRYRNKWYQTGDASGAFFALGIHGQYLYVNPRAETVVAKFSSQPEPVDNDLKRLNLALFDALARLS